MGEGRGGQRSSACPNACYLAGRCQCPAEGGVPSGGWVKPKHDCMDTLNHDPRRKDDHAGSVWRCCECGKAWRVHGFLTWRLRRYDAQPVIPAKNDATR